MAKVFIEETTLTAIGDAIRGKTGKTELIDPANMSTEIAGIEAGGGGGGYEPSEEDLEFSGDLELAFAEARWDWVIDQYGDKVTTHDITGLSNTFKSSGVREIPFQINVNNCNSFSNTFNDCAQLEICPKIRGNVSWGTSTTLMNMILACRLLRDVEDLFTPEMLDGFSTAKVTSTACPKPITFSGCYSLRRLPSWLYKFKLNSESTRAPSSSYTLYYNLLSNCFALDEARDIPVWEITVPMTSNMFSGSFSNCNRLKALTFETNADGTPLKASWKSQTLDLSNYLGYQTISSSSANPISYNSGITIDKKVMSDTQYQALKNDPDWYACTQSYSRYNHDSAVETINSLPDTSEYITSVGGTNTIKFSKANGSATDGGAINTLTEAEIAVAAAKGWTVTLV